MNAIAPSHLATAADWAAFLRPVVAAVRNPPSQDEFKARVAAVATAVHVPAAWLLQPWRKAEAMRKFQFWPAVFDIAEMFADDLRAERERADRRERLALPAPDDDGPQFRTPEEIAAVQAKARALVAELTHAGPKDRNPPARALPLSAGVLLARYERQMLEGSNEDIRRLAEIRAEHIRQRLGVEA